MAFKEYCVAMRWLYDVYGRGGGKEGGGGDEGRGGGKEGGGGDEGRGEVGVGGGGCKLAFTMVTTNYSIVDLVNQLHISIVGGAWYGTVKQGTQPRIYFKQ